MSKMTDEKVDQAAKLISDFANSRKPGARVWFGFNGGGASSTAEKNALRAEITKHAGHPTAELIRDYMNWIREDPYCTDGRAFDRYTVRNATALLRNL